MKLSPQKAIAAHCKGCIYDPEEKGTYQDQIEACTITKCELYEHRPMTLKTRRLQKEKYLASLSPAEIVLVEERKKKRQANMLKIRELSGD